MQTCRQCYAQTNLSPVNFIIIHQQILDDNIYRHAKFLNIKEGTDKLYRAIIILSDSSKQLTR